MHFYPHNIPDFNNATRHLTRVERSVYRDAIERYYDTEEALPADDFNKLARILLCSTQEEKDALTLVLDEFFTLTDAGHEHDRCNAEIAKYRLNSTAKARAGKASAEARKSKRLTPVEQPLNSVEQTNNYELITNNQEPRTNLKPIVPKNKFSDEDMKCAEWLSGKLKEQIPDCKAPNLNGWAKSVRDMRELDKRDHKEICQLWLWCRKDSFEAANVQSPEKLRKRYDQLKTKMKSPAVGGSYAGQPKPSLIDRFIATNYGPSSQDDYGSMGGDDSVIRGEVVEPVRGDARRIGAMETDIIGDFKATGGGCP